MALFLYKHAQAPMIYASTCASPSLQMWFPELIVVLLLSLFTTSFAQNVPNPQANATDVPVAKTCKQMRALKAFVNMAQNETKLESMQEKGKFDEQQVKWIKLNTPGFVAQLESLESNQTLVNTCTQIKAQQKVARKCKQVTKLEKLAELARNETAYNEHLASEVLNQKQVEWLNKKMAKAEGRLQKLKSNNTLMGMCTNGTFLEQTAALTKRKCFA